MTYLLAIAGLVSAGSVVVALVTRARAAAQVASMRADCVEATARLYRAEKERDAEKARAASLQDALDTGARERAELDRQLAEARARLRAKETPEEAFDDAWGGS